MTTQPYSTTDDRPTDQTNPIDYRSHVRTVLLAFAAGLVACLVAITLGASLWLVLIAAVAIPVVAAWLVLCRTLEANEAAIDEMLAERAATMHMSVRALQATQRGQPEQKGGN